MRKRKKTHKIGTECFSIGGNADFRPNNENIGRWVRSPRVLDLPSRHKPILIAHINGDSLGLPTRFGGTAQSDAQAANSRGDEITGCILVNDAGRDLMLILALRNARSFEACAYRLDAMNKWRRTPMPADLATCMSRLVEQVLPRPSGTCPVSDNVAGLKVLTALSLGQPQSVVFGRELRDD